MKPSRWEISNMGERRGVLNMPRIPKPWKRGPKNSERPNEEEESWAECFVNLVVRIDMNNTQSLQQDVDRNWDVDSNCQAKHDQTRSER